MALPLYILLCSGEHEKLQMAAMMASVGAVSERPVEVFVSINAIMAFARPDQVPVRRRERAIHHLVAIEGLQQAMGERTKIEARGAFCPRSADGADRRAEAHPARRRDRGAVER